MQTNYFCPHCERDTIHNIKQNPFVDGNKTTSELQCSRCLGAPIHVKHETGKVPLHDSERVLYPHDFTFSAKHILF